jgi:hypothetical protein
MKQYNLEQETLIFKALRKCITADLIRNGIPSALAGFVVNYYDPVHEDYLQRVDAWQSLLCLNYVTADHMAFIPHQYVEYKVVVDHNGTLVLNASPIMVEQLHAVIRLVYKYKGTPRRDTDWETVKDRFRRPGAITLDTTEIEGIRQVLSVLCPPSSWSELPPGKFGPGTTSERASIKDRWSWEISLPYSVPFPVYSLRLMDTKFGKDFVRTPLVHRYGVTRVSSVPKTIKTDRFISSEPAGNMYSQMSVGAALTAEMRKRFRRNTNLIDQKEHNTLMSKRLKRYTCDGIPYYVNYATIDLSDASDHVSRRLVSLFLPQWKEFLFGVRSTFARFPDGELVPLRTFAPMGSGVCFPVLNAVVLGIAVYACEKDPCHIWGDDAIVPADKALYFKDLLKRSGLVVNEGKSCCSGCYRESCGVELFNSIRTLNKDQWYPLDITALYIKEHPSKVDSATLEQWFQKLDQKNWVATRNAIAGMARHALPTMQRWNKDYQRWEVRIVKAKPVLRLSALDGLYGLVRWFGVRTQQDPNLPNADIHTPSRETRMVRQWQAMEDFPLLSHWFVTNTTGVKNC